jgi:AraC-like DNA-binding protein
MRYRLHTPSPPLSSFIDTLWSLSDAPAHARERIIPSGTLELVINLHEDEFRIYDPIEVERCRRFSGAIVSGTYRECFVIDTREHASVIGVHFRPGGAVPFLGVPPGTLADTHVDLHGLWGAGADELRDRLCSAATTPQRFRILEDALTARLRRPFRAHDAVPVALQHFARSRTSVGEVATTVQLSHRRFIEVFTAEVGMTPKSYARVRRFQHTLLMARRSVAPDWAQLALEGGYCDQSHLIRDFVAFSGFSPAELFRHRNDRVKDNHVALTGVDGSNSSKTGKTSPRKLEANGEHHARASAEV